MTFSMSNFYIEANIVQPSDRIDCKSAQILPIDHENV